MAPIVGVRMHQEMDANRANVAKLEKFSVLNECADKYTHVDADLIESELDQAYKEAQLIEVWFWITMGMVFFEVFACCCMALSPLIKKAKSHDHDDYKSII